MGAIDPKAMARCAAAALLQIVDPSRRSYVDPTLVHTWPAHTKLRVHDGIFHDEETRVEEVLCLMEAWYATVVEANKSSVGDFTAAIMSTQLWASKLVITLSNPPPWGKPWPKQGFTERALAAAYTMTLASPPPPPAAKKLTQEDEERLQRLRYDLRFASGADAEEIREQILAITGEEE